MGSKRIGLARVQALLENLKRELSMAGTTWKGARRPVVTLADLGEAGAIRTAITSAESGTLFTVPALTGDTQTIDLPALSTAAVGDTYSFVMIATAGEVFKVQGASSDKILACKPDGAGNNSAISQAYDSIGFKAAAVLGSMFSVVCITTTAATGWQAYGVIDGLAANVGSIDLA